MPVTLAAVVSFCPRLLADSDLVLETSGRLLRVLALLQARRDWPGPELAARLGVSPRTLRRDMGKLRSLGYPVDALPRHRRRLPARRRRGAAPAAARR
jgi:biotin operon repressor